MMASLGASWISRPDMSSSPYYRTYDTADAANIYRDSGISNDVTSAHNTSIYEHRVPPSVTSENNYAEIPAQQTFTPFNQRSTAYIPDQPGNYMFTNRSNNLPEIDSYRPRDLLTENSPDSGLGFFASVRNYPIRTQSSGRVSTVSSTMQDFPVTQTSCSKMSELAAIPIADRRSRTLAECEFYDSKPEKKVKSCRSVFLHVICMAGVGLVYVALGIVAGYFIGSKGCAECVVEKCPSPDAAVMGDNANTTTETTTLLPTTALTTMTTTPTTTTEATTTTTTTQPLSHCFPIQGVCQCGPFGGDAEREFSDKDIYLQHGNITSFSINHNDYFIGSIQFWYGKTQGPSHGYTTSGYEVRVDLVQNEVITDVHVDFTTGKPFLTRLEIRTNLRQLGPYGGRAGLQMSTQGRRLLYVTGRAGSMIDQLVLVYNNCLLPE